LQAFPHCVAPPAQERAQTPAVQTSPAAQAAPHIPQLFGSLWRSLQRTPHRLLPPRHSTPHAPFEQTSPAAQAMAQAPQFAGSLFVSTQRPLHSTVGAPHTEVHTPPEQTSFIPQAVPQAPQFAGSVSVLTQRLPHLVVPPEHWSAQAPIEQTSPAAHALPQPPQLAGSFWRLAQTSPHFMVPPEHWSAQAPIVQTSPPMHALPQPPQLAGSTCVLTQTVPHISVPGPHTGAVPPVPPVAPPPPLAPALVLPALPPVELPPPPPHPSPVSAMAIAMTAMIASRAPVQGAPFRLFPLFILCISCLLRVAVTPRHSPRRHHLRGRCNAFGCEGPHAGLAAGGKAGDASEMDLSLDEMLAARARISPHVRRTPVIRWEVPEVPAAVTLKLEFLQVGGSFKARGACNRLLQETPARLAGGVVTASGGNHGVGVAFAAQRVGVAATVFLPDSAPLTTENRLLTMGASVVRGGRAWDDAWTQALAFADRTGALPVHPFEDPAVLAGQATVGLELREQTVSLEAGGAGPAGADLDVVVVAIGGGGLICGVASAYAALAPRTRIVGVEPVGAPSMLESMRAGRVVELPSVHTIAGTLAPRAVGPNTLSIARRLVREIVLVSDDEMRSAMARLWDDLRILVEPAGAAAVAALLAGKLPLSGARSVGLLVCGANVDARLAASVIGAV
jgi:threonine dehydratase